jgi:hypothetical protein
MAEEAIDCSPLFNGDCLVAKWTEAFMEQWGDRLTEVDHDVMFGWFSDVMMVGYKAASRENEK